MQLVASQEEGRRGMHFVRKEQARPRRDPQRYQTLPDRRLPVVVRSWFKIRFVLMMQVRIFKFQRAVLWHYAVIRARLSLDDYIGRQRAV